MKLSKVEWHISRFFVSVCDYFDFMLQALSLALEMEKEVTARMKLMIDVCSEAGAEDYHAGDWLTGTWLEEQYQGQRHLAGLINTFNNFK